MAAVFLPVGNHVGGTTWTWVFGVLTACFGILTVTSLLAGRSAGDRRRDISASGYHILCAAAMVYMSAGMSPGMVAMPSGGMAVPGRPRGPTLAAPALGWILLCLAVLDAARHLARLAPRGAARASPGSLPLPTLVPSKGPAPPLLSPPRRSRATRRDVAASLLGSPRLAAAPHLTMDLSMVAMLSTMLPAR